MDYQFLSQTELFQGTEAQTLPVMLECLDGKVRHYSRGSVILRSGSFCASLGLVLQGRVQIESHDLWGKNQVLSSAEPGAVFAETYACLPQEALQVDVLAAEDSEILFLNVRRLFDESEDACRFHSLLMRNLMLISARKNLILSRRIFHTSARTIRGRLLAYLSFQAAACRSREFTIPFDRQQLADYLSVDRSALSHELGKMQKEGLLVTNRNHFRLKAADFSDESDPASGRSSAAAGNSISS